MKDLIAKLQLDANCALGAIWMHIDAQAARIAELEAQIAVKPDDTDKLREALNAWESLRAEFVHGCSGLDDEQAKIVLDIIDDYGPPCDMCNGNGSVGFAPDDYYDCPKCTPPVARTSASTALQAPVREVPEGFKLVPEKVTREMQKAYFDIIDKNMPRVLKDATFGRWDSHREAYTAMLAAAPLPAAPVQQEGE